MKLEILVEEKLLELGLNNKGVTIDKVDVFAKCDYFDICKEDSKEHVILAKFQKKTDGKVWSWFVESEHIQELIEFIKNNTCHYYFHGKLYNERSNYKIIFNNEEECFEFLNEHFWKVLEKVE